MTYPRCDIPRCRQPSAHDYCGFALCDKHYEAVDREWDKPGQTATNGQQIVTNLIRAAAPTR